MRTLFTVIALSALLAGCGSTGFLNRARPDEFAVSRQAPLVVPPDFSLTPPNPGAPRMCEQVGLKVTGLKRVRIGNVTLGNLALGQWRYLHPSERF